MARLIHIQVIWTRTKVSLCRYHSEAILNMPSTYPNPCFYSQPITHSVFHPQTTRSKMAKVGGLMWSLCWNLEKIQRRMNNDCMSFTCGKCHLSSAFPGYLSRQFWKVNANVPEKIRSIGHCGVFTTLWVAERSSSSSFRSISIHKLSNTWKMRTLFCRPVIYLCKRVLFLHFAGARWQARSTRISCKYYVPWI